MSHSKQPGFIPYSFHIFRLHWLVVLQMLLASAGTMAQAPEWLQVNKANEGISFQRMKLDGHGNVYMVSAFRDSVKIDSTWIRSKGGSDALVAKYTTTGNLLWYKIFAGRNNDAAQAVTVDKHGNCYVTGYFGDTCRFGDSLYNGNYPTQPYVSGACDAFLLKLSPNGNYIWSRHIAGNGYEMPSELNYDQDKGLIISGRLGYGYITHFGNTITGDTLVEHTTDNALFQARYDTSGKFLWALSGNAVYVYISGADSHTDGSGFTCGKIGGSAYTFGKLTGASPVWWERGFVTKTDRNGNVKWVITLSDQNTDIHNVTSDRDGGCYITGNYISQLHIGSFTLQSVGEYDGFLAHLDSEGNVLSAKSIGSGSTDYLGQILVDEYGGIYVRTSTSGNLHIDNHIINIPGSYNILLSFDTDINFKWAKLISPDGGSLDFTTDLDEEGYIYVSGFCYGNSPYTCGSTDFPRGRYIGILDLPEDYKTTLIIGKAYQEKNANCLPDTDESGVGGLILKAMPGDRYTVSRTDGSYRLRIPVRDTVRQFAITPPVIQELAFNATPVCPPSLVYSVAIDTFPDTLTGKDFGFQVPECHRMDVNIGSDRRRRCVKNLTSVGYINKGKLEAPNAYILVEFPHWVRPKRSSRSYVVVNDSVWRFNLGTVPPGGTGNFTITDSVLCGHIEILGMIQCTKATVYPAPNCAPPGNWSGAEVSVNGKCEDGIVTMAIYNRTTHNMVDSVDFWMYLDSIRIKKGKVKLAAGDSARYEIETAGFTFYCSVNQVASHPSQVFVSLNIEGCSTPYIPRGVVFPLPQQASSKTQCLQIRGSYDPNDKQVSPKGFKSQGIVPPGTRLDYHIRFQNTGTDTAFIVYVVDTLSDNLDPSTLVLGATSHAAQVSILKAANGQNIIRWYFDRIDLPYKNINEPRSNGFIDFSIAPKAGIPYGSQVENKAAIYFDFNPAVITNATLSTFDTISFTDTALNNNVQVLAPTTLPVLSTSMPVNITHNTAVAGGNIATDGGATVTVRGVCWSTAPNPTTALTTKTIIGSGEGAFSSTLYGLLPSTQYYLRAFAVNTMGTAYGAEVQFTTLAPAVLPSVTSGQVLNITSTTATMENEVTFDGNTTVISRGVCWSTFTNPITALSTKTVDGTGTGPFTSNLINLAPNTTYYARAYVKNPIGTAYGVQRQFTTLTTGIGEVQSNQKVRFYPNPVTAHQLNVVFPIPGSLTLFNSKGQEIYSNQNLLGTFTLPLHLEAGLYFGRITTETGWSTEKVVVLE